MLNSLNKTHLDQKLHFKAQLDNVSDDWADVSYKHNECPSISNGICTIYFGLADLSNDYPFISAAIEDDGHCDLGQFPTIAQAIDYCEMCQSEMEV
tara:strand:- start:250 stop:537 length:288 start_codon:yes stop_codon:yes gene_type:complete